METSADRISRTKTVDGWVTPAFIHNRSYFFVNLQVYADGLVDCWGLVDLALFRKKLEAGWVTTAVPKGSSPPSAFSGSGSDAAASTLRLRFAVTPQPWTGAP